jgi:hypothetical protein
MDPKILALYLPQFYPIKENDEWWGKGFTEWTNVGKAKPLWKGHYQPKVPADLGYYDLRVPEVREQQAELAREAGVTGFLYWHYWFGNGKRIMERVFQEVLDSGKPDFPFALAWANHSWYKKDWAILSQRKNKCLVEQTYPGIDDAREHFNFLLKAFRDDRYIKIDGKPFLLLFDAERIPLEYLRWFRLWTTEAGFNGLYLVGNMCGDKPLDYYKKLGYDAIIRSNILDLLQIQYSQMSKAKEILLRTFRRVRQHITGKLHGAINFEKLVHYAVTPECKDRGVIPQIYPNWDHSPRSGKSATPIYCNAHPKYFYEMACDALEAVKNKPEEEQIIIIKSWNEWGEGNYMEPDLKYGHGYIDALRKAVDKYK